MADQRRNVRHPGKRYGLASGPDVAMPRVRATRNYLGGVAFRGQQASNIINARTEHITVEGRPATRVTGRIRPTEIVGDRRILAVVFVNVPAAQASVVVYSPSVEQARKIAATLAVVDADSSGCAAREPYRALPAIPPPPEPAARNSLVPGHPESMAVCGYVGSGLFAGAEVRASQLTGIWRCCAASRPVTRSTRRSVRQNRHLHDGRGPGRGARSGPIGLVHGARPLPRRTDAGPARAGGHLRLPRHHERRLRRAARSRAEAHSVSRPGGSRCRVPQARRVFAALSPPRPRSTPGAPIAKQACRLDSFRDACQARPVADHARRVLADLTAECADAGRPRRRRCPTQEWATPDARRPAGRSRTRSRHLAWTDDVATLAATDAGRVRGRRSSRPRRRVRRLRRRGRPPSARSSRRPTCCAPLARGPARRSSTRCAAVPAGTKLPWFGPPMSADVDGHRPADGDLGARAGRRRRARRRPRTPTDRLRHVAHIGVRTRDFAYLVHGRPPPAEPFRVELAAPGRRAVDVGAGGRGRSGSPVRRSTSACSSPSAATAPTWPLRRRSAPDADAVARHRAGVRRPARAAAASQRGAGR